MRELPHPLMGLLCRADDHPRQPPPHAACCCCAGRDRLAAGVRCSWRSRLGVVCLVSSLLPHETFLWGAVASATPLRGRCGGAAKERIRGRQGLEETRLLQTPAFSPLLLTVSSSHMFIPTPRGTASAVSVRGKMKIEGSGCSARLLPALEYYSRDTRNVHKSGIHSRPDLRMTPRSMLKKSTYLSGERRISMVPQSSPAGQAMPKQGRKHAHLTLQPYRSMSHRQSP